MAKFTVNPAKKQQAASPRAAKPNVDNKLDLANKDRAKLVKNNKDLIRINLVLFSIILIMIGKYVI